MIVVSNTSPLTNLAAIGQFDLLYHQFGSLHIAAGVAEELSHNGQAQAGYGEVVRADWIPLEQVCNL
ncbi:MAG: DUF3368 domain-containing protein, partial [Gammaproteobacteria bacterium]|nr:DUF3368 domain-containing protein [Gammaproteobacteria bacterium]